MKIYRERETETHFIFEVRPFQLFDLEQSDENRLNPNRREASLSAFNTQTGRRESFAIAKAKGIGLHQARAMVQNSPELPEVAAADKSALGALKITH